MDTPDSGRLHALDAVRGFALLLGVGFHAALSFMPGWPPGLWAMVDNSPSAFLGDAAFVAHTFRMTLFFFIAGFFARLLQQRLGTTGFCRNRLMRIAVEEGRLGRKDLKLGICGEHGGDPRSIEFCHDLGLAYVSCSPHRLPVARLAAAQAALRGAS